MKFPPAKNRASLALVAASIFVAVLMLVVLAGVAAYRAEVKRIVAAEDAMLQAVGELKAGQIERWRRNLAFDAWRLAHGRFLCGVIGDLSDPAVVGELREHLSLQSPPEGGDLLLFSPDGRLLFKTQDESHDGSSPMAPALRRAFDGALASDKPVVSDIYKCPAGRLHIDFVCAVRGPTGAPAGVLVLRSSPDEFLQTIFEEWPIPSETAETLLVQREGDAVVFLNSLRHNPEPALGLRVPMSETNLPTVQWLMGRTDVWEGTDYRGVPVFCHVTQVRDSPWIMVAKIDKTEAFRDLPSSLLNIVLVAVLVLLLAVVLASLLFIGRQRRITRSLRASEERFRSVIENAPEGIFINDGRGVFTDANPSAEKISGFTRDELIGKSLVDLVFPDDLPAAEAALQSLVSTGRADGELRHVTKDGRVRYWQVRAVGSSEDRYLAFVSDVHDRRIAREEAEIFRRRAEALLKLPGAVEAMNEPEFMAFGLDIAEDLTGSRIAFIHFVNPDSETIEFVAWSRRTLEHYCTASYDRHYPVSQAGIWAEALHQRAPVVINDYASHPGKKGLPEGHSKLVRLVSVPVMENDQVVMLAGVGNKPTDYSRQDVETVRLIANEIWHLVQRRRGITALRAGEERTRRLSGLYQTLSDCNQAIVHSTGADELFEKVCRIVVERGGMKMAWVGLAGGEPATLEKVAAFGEGTDYLVGMRIPLSADSPPGRGPAATATRENVPVWCQDFANDPMTAPWHERGAAFGWASCAGLPLTRGGKSVGALTIYSDRKRAFDDDVCGLLCEMAANISFALDGFEREESRLLAEAELAQSMNMLTEVIDASPNAIFWKDTGSIYLGCNKAFAAFAGLSSPDEVVGKSDYDLAWTDEESAAYIADDRSVMSSCEARLHIIESLHEAGGNMIWLDTSKVPLVDAGGSVWGVLGIFEDITARKQLEKNLFEALERAEAANRAKGEFLAVMSHELRTPLNGVLGFAELLSYTALNAEQVEFVQTIQGSGRHLLQVVNDILDFSSIEKKGVELERAPVVIAEIVQSASSAVRKSAADKELKLDSQIAPDVPRVIEGDSRRILQILINLLGNAVKFTMRGSVVLRVGVAASEGRDMLEFSIKDTGIGMSPETLDRIFKPFIQADSTLHRDFEGTGLGLAISQRLAEAMGGRITVASEQGKGSTFTLRIPASAGSSTGVGDPAVPAPVPVDAPVPVRGRILVAEDDRVSAILTGKILSSLGYECDFVTDGQQAVDAFVPGKYPIILLDMQMPVLDGVEAARRIRAIEKGSASPPARIIALTANVLPGDRERCLAAGMDDFVSKPVSMNELAAGLRPGGAG